MVYKNFRVWENDVLSQYHILFVGYANPVFSDIVCHVRDKCSYKTSFIVRSKKDVDSLLSSNIPIDDIYCLNVGEKITEPTNADISYLSSLVQKSVPTIHNMIMGDHIVNKLPYSDGIGYASSLSKKFQLFYSQINPSVIIGCHDGIHSSIGCAVAKKESIPWFALSFCPLPSGYVALRKGIIPDQMISLREQKDVELFDLAEEIISNFEHNQIKMPAYVSAYNIRMVIQRFPEQMREGFRVFKKTYFGGLNKYLEYDFKFLLKQFVRKKKNMLTFPQKWFLKEPPAEPYVFFGLHMQPESTIDVYAPFYSNQFSAIEIIARSIPPTHNLLVKLHISDTDNYSRTQLRLLSRLPGIKLVAPNVSSRKFIDKSSIVITITGNMGLESALLGKPVLIFGRKNYEHFPSVTRIGDITNLPNLIKQKLMQQKPNRDYIITAYKQFLKPYFKASRNDWKRKCSSQEEKDGFVELFRSLEKYLIGQSNNVKEGSV